MSESFKAEQSQQSTARIFAAYVPGTVAAETAVAPSREYPYRVTAAHLPEAFWWALCRRCRRIRYRWKCLDFRVGPTEYSKLMGWLMGIALVLAPILWTTLLEQDKVKARPELYWATVAWVLLTCAHLLHSQFTAGSEFIRWSKHHSDIANEFGGGIERFSRVVRDAPNVPESAAEAISGVVRRLVRQAKEAAAEWVSSPEGTRFRAYLVVPVAANSDVVRLVAETSNEPVAQLPFGEIDAGKIDGLAFDTIHPRVVENTRDERHGDAFARWTYRSIVSFPIFVGNHQKLEWFGCLNIESNEAYVFQTALVHSLLTPVLRPQIELLGLVLLHANQKSIVLR